MPVSPLEAATDVLDRAGALLGFDPGAEPPGLVECDIRRQALVMGVAALDTWMHWSIRRIDLKSLPSRLGVLEVPFSSLVEMGDRSVIARNSGERDRPRVRARNILNEKLLTMTFQNARQWDLGFQMLGVNNGLTLTSKALSPPQTRKITEYKLNSLSHRRNCIVHEGDLLRQIRPRQIKRTELRRIEVDKELDWIRDFLTAADSIA